jgi:hypothetical protein
MQLRTGTRGALLGEGEGGAGGRGRCTSRTGAPSRLVLLARGGQGERCLFASGCCQDASSKSNAKGFPRGLGPAVMRVATNRAVWKELLQQLRLEATGRFRTEGAVRRLSSQRQRRGGAKHVPGGLACPGPGFDKGSSYSQGAAALPRP